MTPSFDLIMQREASVRASLMVKGSGFRPQDWEDLRQELLLDCLRRAPRFDPGRGSLQGFAFGVMRNRGSVLMARQQRCQRVEFLIDDVCSAESKNDTAEVPDAFLAIEVSVDVQHVINGLPVCLRTLAFELCEMSVADISVVKRTSRSSVYRLIGQIRIAFSRAGLDTHSVKCIGRCIKHPSQGIKSKRIRSVSTSRVLAQHCFCQTP